MRTDFAALNFTLMNELLSSHKLATGPQQMMRTYASKSFGAQSNAGAKVDVGGRIAVQPRMERQNWLAFVVILLVSVLVFLIGVPLAMDSTVTQADLATHARL